MSPPPVTPLRLAVFISGRGSNMLALVREARAGRLDAQVALVLSDEPAAEGLLKAAELGIPTAVVAADGFRRDGRLDRAAFESAIVRAVEAVSPDLIILAGYMRVLSAQFVARYSGRLLNIHPSLLPAYKGLHTHERVLAAHEPWHGVSVHFVTAELDGGPVVLQARVPVLPQDTPASLSARVQRQEHIIYPMVINWFAAGRLRWGTDGVRLDDAPLLAPRVLEAPAA